MNEGELIPASAAQSSRAERIEAPADPILARMRFLSRLLDNSIQLPGGYRIGIDPIIGLIPGVGDFVASALSMWLVWDALRLGLPKRIIARMMANIGVETVVGAIPVLGDFVDAAFKANARNMRLVEMHYSPAMPRRPVAGILAGFILLALGLFVLLGFALYLLFRFVAAALAQLFS
jgi:hypothetical protein